MGRSVQEERTESGGAPMTLAEGTVRVPDRRGAEGPGSLCSDALSRCGGGPATGPKPDSEPPSGQAGDVPTRPRCRTMNRTELSTSNLGTWLGLPG